MHKIQDPIAVKILTDAGWFPTRKLERDYVVKNLVKFGNNIFESAIVFMQEFEGLTIEFNSKVGKADISFDVKNACETVSHDLIVEDYEPVAGERLSIIGLLHNEMYAVMIGESGNIYVGLDKNSFELAANDGYSFIEDFITLNIK